MEETASKYGRVAANIFNKHSRTADKGWATAACYETLHRVSEFDGFFRTTKATENEYETWNLERYRSLYTAGSLKTVASEMAKHNVRINVRETRWEGVDLMHLAQDMDKWLAVVKTVMNLRLP